MRNAAETRRRIRETALALFVEKGVEGATTRDIAAGAGIAEGTIYRHYASKEALVSDLFVTNYTAFTGRLSEMQAREDALGDKIEAMVRGFCDLFDRDPTLFTFLLLSQHRGLEAVGEDMETPVDLLRRVIGDGMVRHKLSCKPDLATAMVMGIVLQAATFKVYGRLKKPMGKMAPRLADACRRVLGL